jgi:NADH-quinone oxidoreductase subunit N
MYWLDPAAETAIPVAPLTRVTIIGLAALIFIFGIYPAPILRTISVSPGADAILATNR